MREGGGGSKQERNLFLFTSTSSLRRKENWIIPCSISFAALKFVLGRDGKLRLMTRTFGSFGISKEPARGKNQ